MSAVAVRVASGGDVPVLAALRRAWVEETVAPGTDAGFEARFADWLAAEGDRRTCWLASGPDGRAIAMATLLEYRRMPAPGRPDRAWGYLGNMFVLAAERDRGVGSALLAAVLAAADARGYVRVVLAPSPRSLAFYARAGFLDAGPDAAGDRLLVRPTPEQPRPARSIAPRSG